MRTEIVKRIVAGDSAVWVLIESGDKASLEAMRRAVKSLERGPFKAVPHGWVELDGEVCDITPHHHCERYFVGLRFEDPYKEARDQRVEIPLHRHRDQFESETWEPYDTAEARAVDYCRQRNAKPHG